MRTRECTSEVRAGRLAKAHQFADAARTVHELAEEGTDVADVFVTLAVHAGIAAADVICCTRLGEFSQSEKHADAVELLARADAPSAKQLSVLLGMKTRAGYSAQPIGRADRLRAERAMQALVELANEAS